MMFGIIKCSYCSELQGYELRSKTTACHTCGRRLNISKARTFGPYGDQNEMRMILWDMKSNDMNESEVSLTMEMIDSRERSGKKVLNKNAKDDLIFEILDENGSTFDMILISITKMDIDENELNDILDRLKKSNRIFSPKYGIYKKVK